MNKKLLAVAIAASFVAPAVMADTTVYGRINTQLVKTDSAVNDQWDVEDNASRFGVKGSEDLGNGMKAVFQYEWDVDAADGGDFGGRLAYVGLSGGFGTVAIGRQWTPYYGSVDKTDIMQTNGMNDSYIGPSRVGNALAYISPNFNGFTAKLALVISDDSEDVGDDFADIVNLSLDYNNGPLSVGFSYLDSDEIDSDLWGLAAKYNFGNFALIGQYEEADLLGILDVEEYSLGAEAYFGNNTIRAVYGEIETAGVDADRWALGFEHKFSKRTRVFAEYEDSEIDAVGGHDRFSLGLRHDF